jgi:hypothetical protein
MYKRVFFPLSEEMSIEEQQNDESQIGECIYSNGEIFKKINNKINNIELKKVNTFNFPIGKKEKRELKQIAGTAQQAVADGRIDFSDFWNSLNKYLIYLRNDWNSKIVKSALFDNARIRFDGASFRHFYNSGRQLRSIEELESRAKCLPYLRSIIEKTGVKGCCSINTDGHLGFVIMGRANIEGKNTAIKVIIAKKKKDKLYYLSVNNFGEI